MLLPVRYSNAGTEVETPATIIVVVERERKREGKYEWGANGAGFICYRQNVVRSCATSYGVIYLFDTVKG